MIQVNQQANYVERVEKSKELVVQGVMVLVGAIFLCYGIYNVIMGKVLLGIVDFGGGIGVLVLVGLRNWINYMTRSSLFVSLMMLFLSFLLIHGGTGNVGFLWLLLLPPMTFYMMGSKLGRWFVGCELLLLILFGLLHMTQLLRLPYTNIVIFQLGISYFILALLTYLAERDREIRSTSLEVLQRQMEMILRYSPLVLFRLNEKGVFTFSQGKGLEVLGLEPNQVVGRSVFDAYKEYPKVLEAVQKALVGEAYHHKVMINNAEFLVYYSPDVDVSGRVMGVVGLGIDQSEEYRSRRELSERLMELAKLNQLMIGRELKMVALKEKIAEFESKS